MHTDSFDVLNAIRLRLAKINPGLQYRPLGFDHVNSCESVKSLVMEFEKTFSEKFHLDEDGQDATFFALIPIPSSLHKTTAGLLSMILFSSFERLVTITSEEKVFDEVLDKIKTILVDNKFEYIPFSVFGESYEQLAANGDGGLFSQLFDYV